MGLVYAENKTELSWLIWQGMVYMRTRHDNDMTNHIGAIYVEILTKLSWSIGQDAVNHENQIVQWCDWS